MTVSILRPEPTGQLERGPLERVPAEDDSGTVVLLSPDAVPLGAEVLGVLVRLHGAGVVHSADGFGRGPGGAGLVSAGAGSAGLVSAGLVTAGVPSARQSTSLPGGQGVARVPELGLSRREVHPGLVIDENARLVHSHGEPRSLTRLEFDLLVHFAQRPGRVLTRDALLSAVWDRDPAWSSARTVDVHVLRLRRALGAAHSGALQTVRGVGYRWVP